MADEGGYKPANLSPNQSKAILPYHFDSDVTMAILTITSKGQVTFKKELLRHLESKPGDQLDVTLLPGGRLEVKAAPAGKIETFFGALEGKTAKVASIEEISASAAAGWVGGHR